MKHCEAIALRLINCEKWLVGILSEAANISLEDAEKVAAIYKRAKVVKRDYGNGTYQFKHGAFLDKATILHALSVS